MAKAKKYKEEPKDDIKIDAYQIDFNQGVLDALSSIRKRLDNLESIVSKVTTRMGL